MRIPLNMKFIKSGQFLVPLPYLSKNLENTTEDNKERFSTLSIVNNFSSFIFSPKSFPKFLLKVS